LPNLKEPARGKIKHQPASENFVFMLKPGGKNPWPGTKIAKDRPPSHVTKNHRSINGSRPPLPGNEQPIDLFSLV
jgi:hypothetical protein